MNVSPDGNGLGSRLKMGSAAERRTFEMIDDEDEQARHDLLKYGNEHDKRDMARMGKIQEMRVRFLLFEQPDKLWRRFFFFFR